jgi:hypothetical protein
MDQSVIKTKMEPLDSRITLEMDIEQERKLRDPLRVASVTVKGRDPSPVWTAAAAVPLQWSTAVAARRPCTRPC